VGKRSDTAPLGVAEARYPAAIVSLSTRRAERSGSPVMREASPRSISPRIRASVNNLAASGFSVGVCPTNEVRQIGGGLRMQRPAERRRRGGDFRDHVYDRHGWLLKPGWLDAEGCFTCHFWPVATRCNRLILHRNVTALEFFGRSFGRSSAPPAYSTKAPSRPSLLEVRISVRRPTMAARGRKPASLRRLSEALSRLSPSTK
jgi:hypothetical protein